MRLSKRWCSLSLVAIGSFLVILNMRVQRALYKAVAKDWKTDIIESSFYLNLHADAESRSLVDESRPEPQPQRQKSTQVEERTEAAPEALSSQAEKFQRTDWTQFAYAFIIAGCNPDDEEPSYRGFLYHVLVSASILNRQGAKADKVLVIQIAHQSSHDTLPEKEEKALAALGVKVRYMPKSKHESFYDTVIAKFQILDWLEYKRVLLLDADLLPHGSLDYLFFLSDQGIIRENVVVAGVNEPANAGFFMLQPGKGKLEELHEIVHQREIRAHEYHKQRDNTTEEQLFDSVLGWGHQIVPPDCWKSRRLNGTEWTFHFAFSDQGLLYHWTKYHEKSVSVIFKHYTENYYSPGKGEPVKLMETVVDPYSNYSNALIHFWRDCNFYMCDFHHFTGTKKPWLDKPRADLSEEVHLRQSKDLWWWELKTVSEKLGLGINIFEDWRHLKKRPPLGMHATNQALRGRLARKADELDGNSSTVTDADISEAAAPLFSQPSYNLSNGTQFAYSFIIAGCDPDDPAYRGFLYNTMVSASILRESGSTADVVVVIQMKYTSEHDRLPVDEVEALTKLGVKIRYMPKSEHESFYDTVIAKFQILAWTEYKRVILMDADVMPVGNLDFLFLLSEQGVLRENVIVTGSREPANAGFFMLEPDQGRLDELHEIVHQRELKAHHLQKKFNGTGKEMLFDPVEGWGHRIVAPDKWKSREETGTNWTFHFAFSDQGLLYHWTKYHQKSVSAIYKHVTENYYANETDGSVSLMQTLDHPFQNYSQPLIDWYRMCNQFMCDFHHFTGKTKPWFGKPPQDLSVKTRLTTTRYLWWYTLQQLIAEHKIKFDIWKDWASLKKRPPLGLHATSESLRGRLSRKANTTA